MPVVEYGTPTGLSVKFNSKIIYTCRTGYRISLDKDETSPMGSFINGTNNQTQLISSVSIHCDENGMWSGAVPKCVLVKCENILSISDLLANTTNTTAWTFVNFTCPVDYHIKVNTSDGLMMQTWFVSECSPTGNAASWVPPAKDCTGKAKY